MERLVHPPTGTATTNRQHADAAASERERWRGADYVGRIRESGMRLYGASGCVMAGWSMVMVAAWCLVVVPGALGCQQLAAIPSRRSWINPLVRAA